MPSHSPKKKMSSIVKVSKKPRNPNEAKENLSVLMICQLNMYILHGILSFYVEMGYVDLIKQPVINDYNISGFHKHTSV